jgi:hypothetical protein
MIRSSSVEVQITVMERYTELLKQHHLIKESKAPAFPLLVEHPTTTRALLICKLLVPSGSKEACMNVNQPQHTTSVAARLYPHFLVHVGATPYELVNPGPAVQPIVQPALAVKKSGDSCWVGCCCILLIVIFLSLVLVLPLCWFRYKKHKF